MTEAEIQTLKEEIDGMSQMEMARMRRFAPAGHPFFRSNLPLHKHFEESFKEKGGMTPAISKSIGWE